MCPLFGGFTVLMYFQVKLFFMSAGGIVTVKLFFMSAGGIFAIDVSHDVYSAHSYYYDSWFDYVLMMVSCSLTVTKFHGMRYSIYLMLALCGIMRLDLHREQCILTGLCINSQKNVLIRTSGTSSYCACVSTYE